MNEMNNNELAKRLNEYVGELESAVDSMEKRNFPFSDVEMVYSEVIARLRGIMEEAL